MANWNELLSADEWVIKVAWPSIGAFALGRWVGRVWGRSLRFGPVIGCVVGLALAPVAALIYLYRIRPRRCRWYVVTNQRILTLQGVVGRVVAEVPWDRLERIEVEVLPGQAALRAGDVLVYAEENEVVRLPGVPLPENFVRVCRRTHQAWQAIKSLGARTAA